MGVSHPSLPPSKKKKNKKSGSEHSTRPPSGCFSSRLFCPMCCIRAFIHPSIRSATLQGRNLPSGLLEEGTAARRTHALKEAPVLDADWTSPLPVWATGANTKVQREPLAVDTNWAPFVRSEDEINSRTRDIRTFPLM